MNEETLNSVLRYNRVAGKEIERQQKEIEQLKNEVAQKDNIINEFENWLRAHLDDEFYWFKMYDKLQVLKGSDKE